MPLTDARIRQAKPRERAWKLNDAHGLYLVIQPGGSQLWRFKFRIDGREQKLSFGPYPLVSLKEARALRDEARLELYRGGNPAQRRRAARAAARLRASHRFEDVAQEYIDKCMAEGQAPATIAKARWFLDLLRPALGKRPIAEIEPYDVLQVLKKLERAGTLETARRVRSFASRVFRFGVATLRAKTDPAVLLRGAITAPVIRHYAAILEPEALGSLLRAIEDYQGCLGTRYALRIAPHVFVRPGELRYALWPEFNLDEAVWRIPAGRMKMRRPHAVPLSRQVVAMLQELGARTGRQGYMFPSLGSDRRPISENTLNGALRRMGYSRDEMTAHGLRSTASTLLNESGLWSGDAIERALAHRDTDITRGTYHRGEHWAERVAMAQWWSDYLDDLRAGKASNPWLCGKRNAHWPDVDDLSAAGTPS